MKRVAATLSIASLVALVVWAERPPRECPALGTPMDVLKYEDFRALSHQARVEVFNRMSPEGRERLFQIHVQRWRDENASRLTRDQLEFVNWRVLPLINADLYKQPVHEEKGQAMRKVEAAASDLFSPADVSTAFHVVGIQ